MKVLDDVSREIWNGIKYAFDTHPELWVLFIGIWVIIVFELAI